MAAAVSGLLAALLARSLALLLGLEVDILAFFGFELDAAVTLRAVAAALLLHLVRAALAGLGRTGVLAFVIEATAAGLLFLLAAACAGVRLLLAGVPVLVGHFSLS